MYWYPKSLSPSDYIEENVLVIYKDTINTPRYSIIRITFME